MWLAGSFRSRVLWRSSACRSIFSFSKGPRRPLSLWRPRKGNFLSGKLGFTSGSGPFRSEPKPTRQPDSTRAEKLVSRLLELDDASRFHGFSTLRPVVALVFGGILLYTYRDDLRANVAEEVATVANRSMEDEQLVKRVETLTKDVLDKASTDPHLMAQLRQMLIAVILREETRQAASVLATGVVQDPSVRQQVKDLLKWSVQQLLADPELRQQMLEYVADILKDESTKNAAAETLTAMLKEDWVQQMMADFFKTVLASKTVTDQANDLAYNVSQGVLASQEVKDTASDALWDIMKGAVWARK